MRDYRNIKVYQYADDLVIQVYKLTKEFPREELYGLTSQLRRAAVSVATNIAEGASRQHKRDYLHFLYIARGSLVETECLLHLTHRLGYLNQGEFDRIDELKSRAVKTLFGLMSAVERETGVLSRVLAALTGAAVLYLLRLS